MEKMKSALEIALERSKSLDNNLQKEVGEVEQQKYVKAARALGRSLLQGKINKEGIRESMLRYPQESREAALKAFLDEATKGMDVTNTPLVLQAVTFLKDDAKTRQACAEVEKIYRRYILEIKERVTELQENTGKLMREKLAGEGIKGSALVGFNIKHLGQWKEAAVRLQEEYGKIVQGFRAELFND
ncbi:MAG: hypothetical protein C4554_11360 [Dethiobacter sp.]|jgi:adenine-specific DNA methylase|nr:MAG: hypothetical protein C4554_11360 [Dethiobacter sp.]